MLTLVWGSCCHPLPLPFPAHQSLTTAHSSQLQTTPVTPSIQGAPTYPSHHFSGIAKTLFPASFKNIILLGRVGTVCRRGKKLIFCFSLIGSSSRCCFLGYFVMAVPLSMRIC